MKKIAIIDPASYTLPYDYFYLMEVSKYYTIDFYYSRTKYNYEYIDKLRNNILPQKNQTTFSKSLFLKE